MAKVSVEYTNFPDVNITKKFMQSVAIEMRDHVIDRTEAGNDVNGKTFEKKKNGKPSILKDTGKMIRSIGTKVTKKYSQLVFKNKKRADIGFYHQTGTANGGIQRQWMGFDINLMNKIDDMIKTFVEKKKGV